MSTDPAGIPPHFLVLVPGYMGSSLRDRRTGRTVWGDFSAFPFLNPLGWHDWLHELVATLKYPNDDLEPAGILNEVLFIPPWAKQEHYGRLFARLKQMGYRVDATLPEAERDVYAFAYDWRQDNRRSAQQLAAAIERWRALHPGAQAWIIAHSNGGLVARWYIEHEGGQPHVGRLFLMGSPWDGTPKAMTLLFSGLDVLLLRRLNLFDVAGLTREMFRTFPSAYQLIPHRDPFLRGLDNEALSPYADPHWLSTDQERACVEDAKRFNEALSLTPGVETLVFFGRRQPTTTSGLVRRAAQGLWQSISWQATEAGDGTIPERSAANPHADELLPYAVGHGDIYVHPAVLEKLQWELVDRFEPGTRALVVTAALRILFEPDRDVYSPGEPIHLWATVNGTDEGETPVSNARVQVRLEWVAPLPGDVTAFAPANLPAVRLGPVQGAVGRYEGTLAAPPGEGYYRLVASVDVVGQPGVQLEELVAIEAGPEPLAEVV